MGSLSKHFFLCDDFILQWEPQVQMVSNQRTQFWHLDYFANSSVD